MAQATILQAFTKILTNIQLSTTKEQLETCERFMDTMKQFEDRKDYKQWVHQLNEAYLIRKIVIEGELPIYDVTEVSLQDEHPNNEQGH